MNKVELHHAFLWTCDQCGKENIHVVEKIDPLYLKDLMENSESLSAEDTGEEELDDNSESEWVIDFVEEDENSVTLYVYRETTNIYPIPRRVTCRYCKTSFDAVLEGMEDLG